MRQIAPQALHYFSTSHQRPSSYRKLTKPFAPLSPWPLTSPLPCCPLALTALFSLLPHHPSPLRPSVLPRRPLPATKISLKKCNKITQITPSIQIWSQFERWPTGEKDRALFVFSFPKPTFFFCVPFVADDPQLRMFFLDQSKALSPCDSISSSCDTI
jgi:hypothetical protein